jgi:PAS domain S-box-containing protein
MSESIAFGEHTPSSRSPGDQVPLTALCDVVTCGVVIHGRDGAITHANRAACEILGLSLDQMQGRTSIDPSWQAVHEDGSPFPGETHPAMLTLRTGEPQSGVVMGVRHAASGGTRWLLIDSTPILQTQTGEVREVVATVIDITERKRAQDGLRFIAEASRQLGASLDYETTLARVAELAVPFLADWCLVDVTQDQTVHRLAVACADPSKAELARDARDRFAPDLSRPGGVARVLRTGLPDLRPELTPTDLEEAARDVDHLTFLRQVNPRSWIICPMVARGRTIGAIKLLAADSGRRYGQADLDLAEHLARRAAMAIDNARLHREATEAVRVRDEFIGSISHDLRNPLTAILGYAQMLRRRANQQPAADRMDTRGIAERIERVVKQMRGAIDELLDLARLQSGQAPNLQYDRIDLVRLTQQVIEQCQQTTDKHRLRFESTIPELMGDWDPGRLERTLANLLSNAIKYSPEGGEITVNLAREEVGADDWAILAVRDQGIGIPSEDLPHVFERFRRGGNIAGSAEGHGIGLASARQIVETHGGTITVESIEGVGSTFTVSLPLVPPAERVPPS